MKGATADDWVKMISRPINKSIRMIGVSHHFLRTFKKSQNSRRIASLLTVSSLLKLFFVCLGIKRSFWISFPIRLFALVDLSIQQVFSR